MRFLVAPDKFKGSLDAREVAHNISLGIRDVLPDAEVEIVPVADGGEGTAEAIGGALGAEWVGCMAHDALGRSIRARYAWVAESRRAIVEVSEAVGARQLAELQRDPMRATTFGVGEMIKDAAERGAAEITVGLGGSITNDGGFGLARALGFRFHSTAQSQELTNGPIDLLNLARIEPPRRTELQKIVGAFDVRNPLLGKRGATRVFGPQKGVAPDQIVLLENALTNLADAVLRDIGCDFRHESGAGAAGGLGFALLSFCGADLRPGFEVVAEAIDLKAKIRNSDAVITGEGKLDIQTLEGKAAAGVAELARRLNKRVYAVVGQLTDEAKVTGLFEAVFPLTRPPVTQTLSLQLAPSLIRERAAEIVARINRP